MTRVPLHHRHSSLIPILARRAHGFTLVEMLIAILIASVLLVIAIPSFTSTRDYNRLKGIAKTFANDLRWAQSESAKEGKTIYVRFPAAPSTDQNFSCYGISDTSGCTCDNNPTNTATCTVATVEHEVRALDFPQIKITPSLQQYSFTPRRGLASAGNVQFTNASGKRLWVVISDFGRIRICTNSSYTECANVN